MFRIVYGDVRWVILMRLRLLRMFGMFKLQIVMVWCVCVLLWFVLVANAVDLRVGMIIYLSVLLWLSCFMLLTVVLNCLRCFSGVLWFLGNFKQFGKVFCLFRSCRYPKMFQDVPTCFQSVSSSVRLFRLLQYVLVGFKLLQVVSGTFPVIHSSCVSSFSHFKLFKLFLRCSCALGCLNC